MKKIVCIFNIIIICLFLFGCQVPSEHTTEYINEETTSPVHFDGSTSIYYGNTDFTKDYKELESRESWNIEMEFVRKAENSLIFAIYDYDNIGFYMGLYHFGLEYYNGFEWEIISGFHSIDTIPESDEIMVAIPNPNGNKISCHVPALYSLMNTSELKSGHYRFTKILSGRKFTLEFDLTNE